MRGLTTTATAAAAAGLTALAVTVVTPAIGADHGVKKARHNTGPSAQTLRACLERHGASGVPAADAGGGRALKQWIVEHQSVAADKSALKACGVGFAGKSAPAGAPNCKAGFAVPATPANAALAAKKLALAKRRH